MDFFLTLSSVNAVTATTGHSRFILMPPRVCVSIIWSRQPFWRARIYLANS